MKEYKVISWKMGLTNNNQRLEDTLNKYAISGWQAIHIGEHTHQIVFEKDKNR